MSYFKVQYSFINSLRFSWADFCARTKRAIERVASYAIEELKQEARDDIANERYEVSSINNWLYEQENDVKKWRDDYIREVDRTKYIGDNLITILENKKFYSSDSQCSDVGKKYELDFCDEKLNCFYTGEDSVYVGIKSMYYDGYYGSYSFREDFDPPEVQFGDWID